MVFRSGSEARTPDQTEVTIMASTVSAKSQPLHNISLPDLKWAMNHSSLNRFRKLADHAQKFPLHGSNSDAGKATSQGSVKKSAIYDAASLANSEKKTVSGLPVESIEEASTVGRSKIVVRFRTTNKPAEARDAGDEIAVDLEAAAKKWNFRPRVPLVKKAIADAGSPKGGGRFAPEVKAQGPSWVESTRPRSVVDGNVTEKKEKKRKFSISLTREEIEEDMFAMNGSKPARKPKKRTKNVQKQLDCLFPGLWLTSVTADAHKVPAAALRV